MRWAGGQASLAGSKKEFEQRHDNTPSCRGERHGHNSKPGRPDRVPDRRMSPWKPCGPSGKKSPRTLLHAYSSPAERKENLRMLDEFFSEAVPSTLRAPVFCAYVARWGVGSQPSPMLGNADKMLCPDELLALFRGVMSSGVSMSRWHPSGSCQRERNCWLLGPAPDCLPGKAEREGP